MNAPAKDLQTAPRSDWTREEIAALFALPFPELMFRAQSVHRAHFDPSQVQVSQLLSIKTGGCPEDCGYCTQSVHNKTDLKATKLMEVEAVLEQARTAKASGVSRFCMGAAWRNPKDKDLDTVCAMVEGVKALGMETCVTLGMLTDGQALRVKRAGLEYYHPNPDPSAANFPPILKTRTQPERPQPPGAVAGPRLHVC